MTDENVRTIEINGAKFEVDLRTAKRVDTYKVGDKVKLLTKKYSYSSEYASFPGVIVGIDAFKNLPTLVIAYVHDILTDPKVEFAYINSQSKDLEIAPMTEDFLVPTQQTILESFGRAIEKKHAEIADLAGKRDYFLRQYGTVFSTAFAEANGLAPGS
jgi:hypothetical protein